MSLLSAMPATCIPDPSVGACARIYGNCILRHCLPPCLQAHRGLKSVVPCCALRAARINLITEHFDITRSLRCRTCLELRCRDGVFKDGYGATLDRTGLCLDKSQSVKVKITDSCPCNYPPNAYSNRRWCCNDMPSLDTSQWALEKVRFK